MQRWGGGFSVVIDEGLGKSGEDMGKISRFLV